MVLNNNNIVDKISLLFHDLRSPLSSLKARCGFSNGISTGEKHALYKLADRISGMLSDFEKDLHEKYDSNLNARFNIHQQIQAIVNEKIPECQTHNVIITYQFPENLDSLTVKGSSIDFERALSNIINNAVEACPKVGGSVKLILDSSENFINLTILDNGKGIPKNVLEALKSGEAISYDKEGGHGFGFCQIRETVQKMQGELDIKSVLEIGTVITLRFKQNNSK